MSRTSSKAGWRAHHRAGILASGYFFTIFLLAGCEGQPGQPTAPRSTESHVDSEIGTAPASEAPVGEAAQPFFVGRWASDVANCRELAWVIDEQGLQTPGEVTCRFHNRTRTQRGFDVEATCTAEGPPQSWTLQFSYAQSARALLIENGPFSDIGLVRCEDSTAAGDNAPPSSRDAGDAPSGSRSNDAAPNGAAAVHTMRRADERNPVEVLRAYYASLADRRYEAARRLWTQQGAGSGMTEQALARSFAPYERYEAHVGEPGPIEGAAGSLFVSIPVEIHAQRESGESERWRGEATLRRSNNVPGSTPEQLSWRIFRIDLHPADAREGGTSEPRRARAG